MDELGSSDGVLVLFGIEFRNFDNFLFERDICIGEDLLSELGCSTLCCWIDDDVLLPIDDVTRTPATGSEICLCQLLNPLE